MPLIDIFLSMNGLVSNVGDNFEALFARNGISGPLSRESRSLAL
jgi:hypothetical protein